MAQDRHPMRPGQTKWPVHIRKGGEASDVAVSVNLAGRTKYRCLCGTVAIVVEGVGDAGPADCPRCLKAAGRA